IFAIAVLADSAGRVLALGARSAEIQFHLGMGLVRDVGFSHALQRSEKIDVPAPGQLRGVAAISCFCRIFRGVTLCDSREFSPAHRTIRKDAGSALCGGHGQRSVWLILKPNTSPAIDH